MQSLKAQGCGELFPPGTPTAEIAGYINDWVKQHRKF